MEKVLCQEMLNNHPSKTVFFHFLKYRSFSFVKNLKDTPTPFTPFVYAGATG